MVISIFLERNSGMPEETEEGKRKQKKSKKIKPNPLQSCRTLQLQSEHNTALQIFTTIQWLTVKKHYKKSSC